MTNVERKRYAGIALVACMLGGQANAQLVVNATLTPEQLIQNVLLGGGVTASNITFNGAPATNLSVQAASFTGPAGSNLELISGVILSTGWAASDPANFTFGANGDVMDFASNSITGTYSDADLEDLSGQEIDDAAVLEFDFVPIGDSIKFRYVFGSEEYPSFTCSDYNDAFGFFISGPGISGPFTGGARNIALVPGTTVPVSINTLNSGQPSIPGNEENCAALDPNWVSNSQYFVNNGVASNTVVTYNGFTTVLTASAAVQCGQSYHIKLAIGDGFDDIYDSGVFLEGGSFVSSPFIPLLTPGPGIVGNTVYESCFPMEVNFIRVGDATDAATFQVSYSGTFTNGVDIVPALPAEVVFGAGETSSTFTFGAPIDADTDETIVITVVALSCLGDSVENVFTFNIGEAPELLATPASFSVDCGASVDITPDFQGGYGAYTFDWGVLGTTDTITVAPLSDTTYPVTINDNCGLSVTTEVNVTVIPAPNPFSVALAPAPTVNGSSVQESCYIVDLVFTRSGGTAYTDTVHLTFTGQAENGVDFNEIPNQLIFEAGASTVVFPVGFVLDADALEYLNIGLGDVSICNGGFSVVQQTFAITPAPTLAVAGGNIAIPCGGSTTLQAAATGGYAPYTYQWPDASSGTTYLVGPTTATIYTLHVTDDCGTTATADFNVDLLPPSPINISLQGPGQVVEGCDSTNLNIIRPVGVQGALVVNMSYTGAASNGSDFDQPAQHVIPEGVLNIQVPFEGLSDGLVEDDENVVVTASYTDACGRTVSASTTLMIIDPPAIVVTAPNDITVMCVEDSLLLVATASGGVGSLTLSWNTGHQGAQAYAGMLLSGTYVVTATDQCGRTASASTEVTVDCEIIVPNVFTPNSDGQNDQLVIEGILSTTNTVRIYNRWGQVVYESKNYRNTWNATGVPAGTYYYEVLVDKHEKPYTGHVTILR